MNRRNPIFDETTAALGGGKHHVEAVVDRLVGAAIDDLEAIRSLENTVSDLPSVLARLDAVVAATANVKAVAQAEVVAEVEARVAQLEADFGLTAPAPVDAPVDPSVDPNAPQA